MDLLKEQLKQDYQARRLEREREGIERRKAIYEKHPELQAIDEKIRALSLELSLTILKMSYSDEEARYITDEALDPVLREKEQMLQRLGLLEEDLQPPYDCRVCQDRGHLADGSPCSCFLQELATRHYRAQNLLDQELPTLEKVNFDICTQREQRDNLEAIHRRLLNYVKNFDPLQADSLIFSGPPSQGKTYLSNALARSLSDRGYFVLYQTAPDLLQYRERQREHSRFVQECDFLIIDDLGKEYLSEYQKTEVFQIFNHRIRRKKPFLISTNLNLVALQQRYGEAVFRRLSAVSEVHDFFGEDLRSR